MTGRVEDDVELAVGDQLVRRDGSTWLMAGWVKNTAGRHPVLVRVLIGERMYEQLETYSVALTNTFLREFPDVVERMRA